jgi:hypothetical protein
VKSRDFLILAILLILLSTAASGQDFAPLRGAQTTCGLNGTRFTWNPDVAFRPANLQSGRARYGPCFGGACNDLGGRCIVGESLRAEILQKMQDLRICRGLPDAGLSEQDIHDIGLTIGSIERLRSELARCAPKPAATCPAGQTCQGPCPSCPPPAAGIVPVASRLPQEGALVEVWVGAWLLGAKTPKGWMTCRGLRQDVTHWRELEIP